MTVDTVPGCQVEIVSGYLSIDGKSFSLRNGGWQTCEGAERSDMSQAAAGTVVSSGSSITLQATSGPAFGKATGTVDPRSGEIHITSLTGDQGTYPVSWKFRRR